MILKGKSGNDPLKLYITRLTFKTICKGKGKKGRELIIVNIWNLLTFSEVSHKFPHNFVFVYEHRKKEGRCTIKLAGKYLKEFS